MRRLKPFLKIFKATPLVMLLLVVCITLSTGCKGIDTQGLSPDPEPSGSTGDEQQLFADTFRIDIQSIDITFDYYPGNSHVEAQAIVVFRMRPGQDRPIIHFDPALRGETNVLLNLNGETLDFNNTNDVQILDIEDTTQDAIQFQRQLAANIDHTLEMSYGLDLPVQYPRFSSEVSDLYGDGNEELFPTINVPHELAHHRITFRVHSQQPFRCIGSGRVEPIAGGNIQEWRLDTEREVASYTVMFVIMPEADTLYQERTIDGVNVRIMAYQGGALIDDAFNQLEPWLPELRQNIGPFPMPRGISIFLTSYGGGMEYFGGTITSLWALNHEVFHMYYGCSTVANTYRDSWWDEAINEWYENSAYPGFQPIPGDFHSNIVSGRSPIGVGWDFRAYDEGSRIMQAVALELGDRDTMIGFLRYIQQNYAFSPFNTQQFLDYLEEYSGIDMRTQFNNWLYEGIQTSSSTETTAGSPAIQKHKVDMTPPLSILKKYSRNHSN